MGLVLSYRAAGFTTSLAPMTRATSHCGMSGLISSISVRSVYGMSPSAGRTFRCPAPGPRARARPEGAEEDIGEGAVRAPAQDDGEEEPARPVAPPRRDQQLVV